MRKQTNVAHLFARCWRRTRQHGCFTPAYVCRRLTLLLQACEQYAKEHFGKQT